MESGCRPETEKESTDCRVCNYQQKRESVCHTGSAGFPVCDFHAD